MLVVDAGPLVAAAATRDRNHHRCVDLLTNAPRPLVVPVLVVTEVAYFLQRLDDSQSVEANGKTILENSLLTISTESGDGRHNDPKRELSGVFHAITSAGGRFKTGQFLDLEAEGLDVYNTMLEAMGVSRRMGPAGREMNAVDAIRA